MSESTKINIAKQIMGQNFIGPDELKLCKDMRFEIPNIISDIMFTQSILKEKREDYILVFGVSKFYDGKPITIRNMIDRYGKNPEEAEPCFYNQDWYEYEDFIDIQMSDGWFFIRKNIYENSRAVQPDELMRKYCFPSAIRCCYTFFTAWKSLNMKLWYHDFVWCSDTDHNGDRIYVGKYNDVDGVNKNGFSIHRHLALRSCYGCVD